MIRRSFRFGLLLGLLGGVAFAMTKVFGARPDPPAPSLAAPTEPWPRLAADPTVAAAPVARAVPDPAVAPGPVAAVPSPVAPVEEAILEPATPAPASAPAAKPVPAKQGASKKAPAKTKAPAKKAAAKRKAPLKAWVEPTDGICPTSHPVKAKLASQLFHLPGMFNYERTKPDRCYLDAAKAEADGLRASKR